MIEVTHHGKRYGAHQAVQDLSFTVSPGTVSGLLGSNGAGKTTTIRRPTAGTVRVADFDV
ncbi:ATP-binding cassette domain-containing protein [Deinococcus aerophilus]|uniref:ABC transporter domain-containing protein n=1 Tax=Deinococcus aerophilus TaxID=522488 RepID=A0ABQ2GT05_9DEIO|nr:ATP-binding cassette domain-containing protein [Deinococcus aerophilus]GGM09278.1 hypothetical protein GCM10010841_17090 [Deinococcus aerophilus]